MLYLVSDSSSIQFAIIIVHKTFPSHKISQLYLSHLIMGHKAILGRLILKSYGSFWSNFFMKYSNNTCLSVIRDAFYDFFKTPQNTLVGILKYFWKCHKSGYFEYLEFFLRKILMSSFLHSTLSHVHSFLQIGVICILHLYEIYEIL